MVLSWEVTQAIQQGARRLLVMEPPRHGKSEFISHYLPSWYVGRYPDRRVLLASYESSFAQEWGRKARDTFAEWAPTVFGLELDATKSATANWGIQGHPKGGMATGGVGGPMTGRGANLLIVDDPVKNAQEANSPTMREAAWDWWNSTAVTRLEPGGVAIVLMTRWHEDDLGGRLLEQMRQGGEAWKVIRMPALAEADEDWRIGDWAWTRKKGEALWPERYPRDVLEQIRDNRGAYWWAALYQQQPRPMGGALFKAEWFRYFRETEDWFELLTPEGMKRIPKEGCWRFATVDLAASEKTTADYFVIGSWAVTPETDTLLLDVRRERLEGPDQLPAIRQEYEKWNLATVCIENAGYQLTMVQSAVRAGLPAEPLRADSDKWSRALTPAARMSQGKIYFRAGARYLSDLEKELLDFPTGKHDDQVDMVSYAAIRVAEGVGPRSRRV